MKKILIISSILLVFGLFFASNFKAFASLDPDIIKPTLDPTLPTA